MTDTLRLLVWVFGSLGGVAVVFWLSDWVTRRRQRPKHRGVAWERWP